MLSTGTKTETTKPDAVKSTQKNVLSPGQLVATNQFVCKTRGRLTNSMGKTEEKDMYCGGTIFCDIASKKIEVFPQVSLSANETIRSKHEFERESLYSGVQVMDYVSDNGVYTSQEFMKELQQEGQGLKLCGVGAHHQNGVAERAIRTVVERARSMLLHAACKWPGQVEADLWLQAMQYATYLWNNTPIQGVGLSPEEIFTRTKQPHAVLTNAKVWGCPCYVLDP